MSEQPLENKDTKALLRAADQTVPEIISTLRETAPAMIATQQEIQRGFEERLADRWREPFQLYYMVLTCAREMVADFDREHRDEAAKEQDFVFEVLHRLAVRACRAAAEVMCLLQGGFADGAHARWRTVHELAAMAFFVHKAGLDTAERYLLYEDIEVHKAALQLQDHAGKLKVAPYDTDTLDAMKKNRDFLVAKYGSEFAQENGWAFGGVKKLNQSFKGRIGFDTIERCAGIGHLRPYYKMASNQVHAGPKGASFTLGSIGKRKINLVGASNAGLADAGQGALISLVQVMSALSAHKTTLDRLLGVKVLNTLVTEAAIGFVAVQRKLEEDENLNG